MLAHLAQVLGKITCICMELQMEADSGAAVEDPLPQIRLLDRERASMAVFKVCYRLQYPLK
jgi:hypothetical protein